MSYNRITASMVFLLIIVGLPWVSGMEPDREMNSNVCYIQFADMPLSRAEAESDSLHPRIFTSRASFPELGGRYYQGKEYIIENQQGDTLGLQTLTRDRVSREDGSLIPAMPGQGGFGQITIPKNSLYTIRSWLWNAHTDHSIDHQQCYFTEPTIVARTYDPNLFDSFPEDHVCSIGRNGYENPEACYRYMKERTSEKEIIPQFFGTSCGDCQIEEGLYGARLSESYSRISAPVYDRCFDNYLSSRLPYGFSPANIEVGTHTGNDNIVPYVRYGTPPEILPRGLEVFSAGPNHIRDLRVGGFLFRNQPLYIGSDCGVYETCNDPDEDDIHAASTTFHRDSSSGETEHTDVCMKLNAAGQLVEAAEGEAGTHVKEGLCRGWGEESELYTEIIPCPSNRCENGACLKKELKKCSETDYSEDNNFLGKDGLVKGTIIGHDEYDNRVEETDYCVTPTSDENHLLYGNGVTFNYEVGGQETSRVFYQNHVPEIMSEAEAPKLSFEEIEDFFKDGAYRRVKLLLKNRADYRNEPCSHETCDSGTHVMEGFCDEFDAEEGTGIVKYEAIPCESGCLNGKCKEGCFIDKSLKIASEFGKGAAEGFEDEQKGMIITLTKMGLISKKDYHVGEIKHKFSGAMGSIGLLAGASATFVLGGEMIFTPLGQRIIKKAPKLGPKFLTGVGTFFSLYEAKSVWEAGYPLGTSIGNYLFLNKPLDPIETTVSSFNVALPVCAAKFTHQPPLKKGFNRIRAMYHSFRSPKITPREQIRMAQAVSHKNPNIQVNDDQIIINEKLFDAKGYDFDDLAPLDIKRQVVFDPIKEEVIIRNTDTGEIISKGKTLRLTRTLGFDPTSWDGAEDTFKSAIKALKNGKMSDSEFDELIQLGVISGKDVTARDPSTFWSGGLLEADGDPVTALANLRKNHPSEIFNFNDADFYRSQVGYPGRVPDGMAVSTTSNGGYTYLNQNSYGIVIEMDVPVRKLLTPSKTTISTDALEFADPLNKIRVGQTIVDDRLYKGVSDNAIYDVEPPQLDLDGRIKPRGEGEWTFSLRLPKDSIKNIRIFTPHSQSAGQKFTREVRDDILREQGWRIPRTTSQSPPPDDIGSAIHEGQGVMVQ